VIANVAGRSLKMVSYSIPRATPLRKSVCLDLLGRLVPSLILPVSAGRYRIAAGVYDPDTLERLRVQTRDGTPVGERLELEEDVRVP
jgi:hypothetical protein